jgi:hypothetical protein
MQVSLSAAAQGGRRRPGRWDLRSPTTDALDRADLLVVDDPNPNYGRPDRPRTARGRALGQRARLCAGPRRRSRDLRQHRSRRDSLAGTVLNGRSSIFDRRIRSRSEIDGRDDAGPMRVLVALGGGHHVRRVARQVVRD